VRAWSRSRRRRTSRGDVDIRTWTRSTPTLPPRHGARSTSRSKTRRCRRSAPSAAAGALAAWARTVGLARAGQRLVALTLLVTLTLLAPCAASAEEDSARDEFWPELDVYHKLSDHSRLFLLASLANGREQELAEGLVGGHVDLYLKPLFRPRDTPDAASRRYLMIRLGYRYAWDLEDRGEYKEHRVVIEATGRLPPLGPFLAVNRNRLDLRAVNGERSWRYRNRTRIESEFPLGSRSATPYVMVELYYDSRYDDWNRQRYFAGVEWPVWRKAILDTYYCRQNDSRASLAHVNGYGLALNLFF
jgi:hypothetical protein